MDLQDLKTRATITVPEAAELLGISKDVAYASVKAGEIPALTLGHRIVIPVGRFLAWLGNS